MTETLISNKAENNQIIKAIKKFNSLREENTEKYRWLNIVLLVLFPIFTYREGETLVVNIAAALFCLSTLIYIIVKV